MAVTDQQKLDFLLKKIGFTKTKTGSTVGTGAISGTPKQPFAEAIPSPLIIANGALWNESDQITTTPPGSDTDQIKVYSASSALRMTADATSSGQRAYIAYSTYNDTSSTRLTNWIDTQFGALYLIKVYKGDPNSGGVALSAGATNENWFFDYSAGVLNFNDSNVPSGVTDTNIYIVGYRYIGQTGAPTSGISTFSFKDLTVERNLDVGPLGGISTFRNSINALDIIKGYKYLAAPYSGTTTTLTVTVASKVSGQHRYHGQGSGLGYVIDGYQSPFFTLTPGNTYRFDQSDNSNSSHQIKFYLEADKTTLYEEGVTYNGTAGSSGAYTQIVVSDKTPVVLHYQCINHGYMGNAFQTNANVVNTNYEATIRSGLNVSGVSTFSSNVDINANIDVSGNSVLQGDLDVDGHTNLDNVSVSGITTFSGIVDAVNTPASIRVAQDIQHKGDADTKISFPSADTITFDTAGIQRLNIASNGNISVTNDLDVDGHTNLDNISVAGVSTFTGDATFSGSVSIGGTLTYEDVTNVDSVGLLTARSGIRVTGGVIEAQAGENKIPSLYANMAALPSPSTYHGMFAHVHSTGRGYFAHGGAWYELVNADLTGRVGTGTESYFIDRLVSTSTTATSLNVVGVATFGGNVDVNGNVFDADGHVELDNVNIAGVTTFAGNIDANGDLDVDGHTNLDNVSIAGVTTATGLVGFGTHITLEDYGKIQLGNKVSGGNRVGDFYIRHNPTLYGSVFNELISTNGNILIENRDAGGQTRNLYIKSNAVQIRSYNGNESFLTANLDQDVKIFYDNAEKLATTNTGINVIGNVVSDGLVIDGDSDLNGDLDVDGHTNLDNVSIAGFTTITQDLDVDGHTNLDNVNIVGVTTHEGHILPSADSTYDLGSSSKYWRHVYADNVTGGGGGVIIGDDIITRNLQVNGISTHVGIATFNNATFHDDVTFTTANGNNILFDKSDNALEFGDSVKATFGNSGDLEIFHNGTNSLIENSTGVLVLRSDTFWVTDKTNFHGMINANRDGAVNLYYDNVKRFETTNTGINVTGNTETDSLNTGNATFTGTITAGGATGTSGQYLKSTGSGVAWASFPTARTSQAFTASAGQTTFSFSYTVGLVDVFVNGIKLSTSEFTATNGSSVVLAVGCFVGDIVEILSYNVATGGGGGGTLSNIVEDTTPQLGGNLDLFNKTINGTGNINITGVITATQFKGDGSGLTGIVASGSGVVVKDGGSTVGTAGTINFGDNLSVSAISAGIVTITGFSGITTTSGVVSIANDLDVDGHTNLDNVSIAGVSTFGDHINTSGRVTCSAITINDSQPGLVFEDTNANPDFILQNRNGSFAIRDITSTPGVNRFFVNAANGNVTVTGDIDVSGDLDVDGHTNLDNVSIDGVTTFAGNIGGTATFNNIDVDGHTELDNVNIAGVVTATTFKGALQGTSGTFSSGVDITGDLDVDGHTDLDNVSVAGVVTATTFVGALTGNVTGNVSGSSGSTTGNAATATALQNARTIGGVSFDGTANINLPGVNATGNQDTSGNAATATEATNVTVTANNSTNETVYPVFVDGATGTQGAETDTGLNYNPSTGNLSATKFTGDGSGLTGITASGSGIVIKHDGSTVGTAGTINFGTNLDVSTISGGAVTITASGGGVTINNNANNRLITGSGTANTLEAESGLTYDGTYFNHIGSGFKQLKIESSTSNSASLLLKNQQGSFTINTINNAGNRNFTVYDGTAGVTRFSINHNGTVGINNDLDVDGHTNLDNVSIAGVCTATSFEGDGSNLTGISANVGITTNLSGSFTASAGSPSTINTFGYGSGDIVVEYTVFIKNGSNFQSQKLLAMRDGTTIHSTQFAVMFSSSLLVQLDATISSGNILLRATPETGVSGSTTYKVKREVM